jgi:hypothetical protein
MSATTRLLLAGAGLTFLVVGVPASGAGAAAPHIKVLPAKLVDPGTVLSVLGKGATTGDVIAQCSPSATTTASCDLASQVPVTADAKGNVTAPTTFTIPGPGDGLCGTGAPHVASLTCGVGLISGSTVLSIAKVTFPDYYLSLGDSYSVGYQPSPSPMATFGYTGYVAKKEKLTLENFGCAGATTASMTTFTGVCGVDGFGPPAAFNQAFIPPGDSQITAADTFIAAHPNQIGLITVSISGNDITPCATASPTNVVNGATAPLACVQAGMASVSANIGNIVTNLNTAAPSARLVGLTYPDVLLGLWVCTPTGTGCATGDPTNPLITQSQLVFQLAGFLNPTLQAAYTSVPVGMFVDVTNATGGYTTLATAPKKNVPPYGKIPVPVANVCALTWYCALGNIHENTKGYQAEGKDITTALG